MAATVAGVLLTGVHASRPSSGVSVGTLYSCTTHSLVYQTSDTGSTWTTWASLAGTAAGTVSTVEEVDGSPTDSAVTKIVFPNGTLGITSHVATYTPTAAPTASEAFMTSNLTLTSANTFYDGPSLSLAAGTYVLWGSGLGKFSTAGFIEAKLWDGTNVYHTTEAYNATSGADIAIGVTAGNVVLGGTVTVKISYASSVTGNSVLATAQNNGDANKATKIVALKIA